MRWLQNWSKYVFGSSFSLHRVRPSGISPGLADKNLLKPRNHFQALNAEVRRNLGFNGCLALLVQHEC